MQPDHLLKRAEALVPAATLLGVSSYTPYANEIPIIHDIDTEQWDWVFTVAGVFVAATRLNNIGVAESSQDAILEVITERLAAWKPDGIAGFEDCKAFFERTYDGLAKLPEHKRDTRFLSCDSIGAWMAWNVLHRAPATETEWKLSRLVGIAVTAAFFDWWGANDPSCG